MRLPDYPPVAANFVSRTVAHLRAGVSQGDPRRLARAYRGMSDHGLADIGFCRTRIEIQVLGDNDRR